MNSDMKIIVTILFMILMISCNRDPDGSCLFVPCDVEDSSCQDCVLTLASAVTDDSVSSCSINGNINFEFGGGNTWVTITLPIGCTFSHPPDVNRLGAGNTIGDDIEIFTWSFRDNVISGLIFRSDDVEHALELGLIVSGEICCGDDG